MLTQEEINYLRKISPNKKVNIKLFDQKLTLTADKIIKSVKRKLPSLKVLHMGASKLRIAGQGDLDIYALESWKNFDKYLPGLIKLFGHPLSKKKNSIEWNFKKVGIDVEFYLTDPTSPAMARQIRVFDILRNDLSLLKRYEKLKLEMDGSSFRDYQRKKYEFFNEILERPDLRQL